LAYIKLILRENIKMSDKCDKDIEEYNKCQFGIPFEKVPKSFHQQGTIFSTTFPKSEEITTKRAPNCTKLLNHRLVIKVDFN
jgi:hypothetical protein